MTTKLNMTRDINGYNAFGLVFTDTAYSCTLTQNTDTTLTVPGNMGMGGNGLYQSSRWLLVFNYDPGTSTWVALNTMAGVPAGATFAATSSELNPAAREVKGGDVIHFYSPDVATDVSVIFYSLS